MEINAKITGISYKPLLCKDLLSYDKNNFESALNREAAFLLNLNGNSFAVSSWVSPKRTRSYPYARVYNTLGYSGKKVTIIPFVKDEGIDGDRDFLQWDTISLMSLLGVNVIIAYYVQAAKNKRYQNKITNQQFDISFVCNEIERLLSYQSDALHWNIEQIDNISKIAGYAKLNYEQIHRKTGVILHSAEGIEKRIDLITESKNAFMQLSRDLAKTAQIRETKTIQPKEYITNGIKAQINITNYLGGIYYFTSDEVQIQGDMVCIIEGKHTKTGNLPSIDDIKDGLVKMILYSNLKDVTIDGEAYTPIPVLKLTAGDMGCGESTSEYIAINKTPIMKTLVEEARINAFKLYVPLWEEQRIQK
jgi:hypothetical protein